MTDAERIARAFHETYEDLAPKHGWETQERSRKDWNEVPPENKALMLAVVQTLLDKGIIVTEAPLRDALEAIDIRLRSWGAAHDPFEMKTELGHMVVEALNKAT